jgi:hypothetical protein
MQGSLSIRDLRIPQPEGFDKGSLLSLPELNATFRVTSFKQPSLTLEKIGLKGLEVHLAKNKKGELNASLLVPEPSPDPAHSTPAGEGSTPGPDGPKTLDVLTERLTIDDGTFSYDNSSVGDDPVSVLLAGLQLTADHLHLAPSRSGEKDLPGSVRLTGRLVQPPHPNGLLGLFARIGILGDDLPTLNAALRIGGLELESLGSVVPAGASTTLGGDSLDLSVDLALAPEVLDTKVKVEAPAGQTLSFSVGGTPRQPALETSDVLFTLMLRSGGGIGNLAGNVGGAGAELAATTVTSAAAVGIGTAKAVGSVGLGLFDTTKGAATADLDTMLEGFHKTTAGMAEQMAGGFVDAGDKMATGTVEAGSATAGMDRTKDWRASHNERWSQAWQEAQARVREMPYPKPRTQPAVTERGEGHSEPAGPGLGAPPGDGMHRQD